MAGSRKHGAHREHLTLPLAAAAVDTGSDIFTYDGYAEGGASAGSPTAGYDLYQEALVEAVLVADATLTGQATNYATILLTHRNAAGTTVDQLSLAFVAGSSVLTAFVPASLAVGSGIIIPGLGGTLVMSVASGVALPWKLVPGDTITLSRGTHTGTGLATPNLCCTLVIAGSGA